MTTKSSNTISIRCIILTRQIRSEHQLVDPTGWSISLDASQACRRTAQLNFGTSPLLVLISLSNCQCTLIPCLFLPHSTFLLTIPSLPLHHNYTVPLVDAISQWDTFARDVIPVDTSRALATVWIGINDIGDSDMLIFPTENATSFSSFYTEIIATEFEALEKVYDAGYRSYLFMNLPPLERTVRSPFLPKTIRTRLT